MNSLSTWWMTAIEALQTQLGINGLRTRELHRNVGAALATGISPEATTRAHLEKPYRCGVNSRSISRWATTTDSSREAFPKNTI